jgi:hypothetical protein
MSLRTIANVSTRLRNRSAASTHRLPVAGQRPGLYLGVATAGALMVGVITGAEPAAQADGSLESVSIAQELGISADASAAAGLDEETVRPLEQLVASRSERDAAQAAAAQAQAAADQAERDRQAAEAAAAQAAAEEAARLEAARAAEAAAAQAAAEEAARAEAARAAEAAAAAARPGQGTNAPVAPAGSYRDYALQKLGGDAGQFSCLQNLWGKESGWNPNAQNPSSTAYGIAQFLDSTWAGTGIAKTSDGYRQIDAGLIYIEKAYGSPCAAWSHSQANNWY